MTTSLMLACLWCVAANVIGMLPSKKKHWPSAYVLMTVGVPLLGFVFWENGVLIGALVLVAALSIFRWPVVFFARWVKGFGRGTAGV